MSNPSSPLEKGLRLMGAQQQLAARSLINMIEMISTSSHRYAADTTAFTKDAMELVNEAARTRDVAQLAALQQKWADTCLKYGQDQTRATMSFVEQCGMQALHVTAQAGEDIPPPEDAPKAPKAAKKPSVKTPKKEA